MITPPPALRLRLDGEALVANWRWLDRMSGAAACGAAVKADGYGLGAHAVVKLLAEAGCRDFFVSTWAEVGALGEMPGALSVLHGARDEDVTFALQSAARPVLNTPAQVRRWKAAGGGPCDVMVDTGMNRLGLSVDEVTSGLLDGLTIETLMSHLACADEDSPINARQLADFAALSGRTGARRMSFANSAGICLGADYGFDLTRPGLALYGGIPRAEAATHIQQVVFPEAQVVQRRRVGPGQSVGYGATWTADRPTELAILNIGYADGYLRCFAGGGFALRGDRRLPLVGRVSMDLIAVDVSEAPDIGEGDWLAIGYALSEAASASGLSQYELLTGLGERLERVWI